MLPMAQKPIKAGVLDVDPRAAPLQPMRDDPERQPDPRQLVQGEVPRGGLESARAQIADARPPHDGLRLGCDYQTLGNSEESGKKKIEDEFYFQGDLERTELNDPPNPMMDRQKREEFPSHQVGYVDFICEPLYEHLVHQEHLEYLKHLAPKDGNNIENNGAIFTNLDPMLEGCRKNRENWSALIVNKEETESES